MTHMSQEIKESASKMMKGSFFQLEIEIFSEKESNDPTDIPGAKNVEPSGKG